MSFRRTWEGASPDLLPFPNTSGTHHLTALHKRISTVTYFILQHMKNAQRSLPLPPTFTVWCKHEARNSMSLFPIKEKLLNPCYLTLSRRCIIIGTRFASITAWTCCWFPAVMLDRNHTASCKIKGCEKLLIQIVFYIIFYFYYKISYIHIFRSAIHTLVNLKYNQVCIGLIVP